MNNKLIDYLVVILNEVKDLTKLKMPKRTFAFMSSESLSPEEQIILEAKLREKKINSCARQNQKLVELKEKIFTRRQGKDFDPPLDQYIIEARDERNAQQEG